MAKGKVYLVGAGPGDPGLLTVEATRLLQTADVIFHDDLVSREILELIPEKVHVENVGKRCGHARIAQHQIHSLMINAAKEGWRVVRLKSGDPLIFGRAGEEMDALRSAGIEYEIAPGITAAFGAAARAGIPLTDRRLTSKLVFLSNHQCAGKDLFDWKGAFRRYDCADLYAGRGLRTFGGATLQRGSRSRSGVLDCFAGHYGAATGSLCKTRESG